MTEKTKEELLEILGNLRALSKQKKYRLARPEYEETIKTLSSFCLLSLDGIKFVLEVLPDFQSDIGAEVVVRNWVEISAHIEELHKAFQGTNYKTELGKRLRLLIGQRLSSTAPNVASKIIIDVCKDMQSAKKEFPTSKDLHIINSTLLVDGISILVRLTLDSALPSRAEKLVSHCLASGFSLEANGKSLATPQTQLDLIRWANKQPSLLNIGIETQRLITSRILDWNDDIVKLLRSELDTLHSSLSKPIKSALEKLAERKSQIRNIDVISPVTNQPVGYKEQTANISTQPEAGPNHNSSDVYDAFAELEHLTNYFRQTNMALNRSQEDVARLERNLRQVEDDLRKSRQEKEKVEQLCALVEIERADSLERCKSLEQSINSQQDQIESLNSKLVDADNLHKDLMETHRSQIDKLSRRISQEGDHRLTIFRNKLADMLRPFVVNMKEAQSMEMTQELGVAMQTQLKQILSILKSQGVTMEGVDT